MATNVSTVRLAFRKIAMLRRNTETMMYAIRCRQGLKYEQAVLHRCYCSKQVKNALHDDMTLFTNHLSEVEVANILSVINQSEEKLLSQYSNIGKNKASGIVNHRAKHGFFPNLESVLAVKGIGLKALKIISRSILNEDITTKKRYQVPTSILHPKFSADMKPQSVVGCHVLNNAIAWLHLSEDLVVQDWQHTTLFPRQLERLEKAKYDFAACQSKIWELVTNMPVVDVYLIQDMPVIIKALAQVNTSLNTSRVEAVLTTMLNLQISPAVPLKHKVHKLRYSAVSRHFNLQVGKQRVNSIETVHNIERGMCKGAAGVILPAYIYEDFVNKPNSVKEHMTHPLLTSIAFYKLLEEYKMKVV